MRQRGGYFRTAAHLFAAMVLVGLTTGRVAAQYPTTPSRQNVTNPYGDAAQIGANPFETAPTEYGEEGAKAQQDTTKRKPKKPLESYFFDDSTRKRPNFVWTVDTYRNRVEQGVIDTAMLHHQIDFPFLREDVGDAYVGPLGAGSIPLNYIRRDRPADFTFSQPFYSYIFTPENVLFYNGKRPFTLLSYTMAGKKTEQEENLRVIHAQNISPSTGFNITYNNHNTRGMYKWQAAKDKNLSLAFNHTGKRYSLHAGYIYNATWLNENGGLIQDREVGNKDYELTRNIPFKLTDAQNLLKNNRYYLVQSYGFPLTRVTERDFSIADKPSIFFGHAFEYSRYWKRYSDTRAGTIYEYAEQDEEPKAYDYYTDWFINPAMSADSIFESRLSNRIFMQIQPWDRNAIVGVIDGGIGIDNHQYYNFAMENYLTGRQGRERLTTYYAYGSVEGRYRRYFDWDADVKYNIAGYRIGDLALRGNIAFSAYIKGRPVTLSGRFAQTLASPGYWEKRYYSNHYKWDNSFDKESETRVEVKLDAPFLGLEAGAYQSVVTNKIYYNSASRPQQFTGTASLTGLYIQEYIPLGGLHLNHRVLLQWSTEQEVIPVPFVSAFISYFYEFNIVKDVLRLQIGFDGRYNTAYYGFGYNPALAQFYNQNKRKLGDYPKVDVFLNAKWKRMRIMLKFDHLDQGWIESNNYFQVAHYPLNGRMFKIGISWSFYD